MASLSSGGKIRKKSRKPLKLEALEEVSRSLLVFGGSAGTVLSLLKLLLWLFDCRVPSATDVGRIVVVSLCSRGRTLAV